MFTFNNNNGSNDHENKMTELHMKWFNGNTSRLTVNIHIVIYCLDQTSDFATSNIMFTYFCYYFLPSIIGLLTFMKVSPIIHRFSSGSVVWHNIFVFTLRVVTTPDLSVEFTFRIVTALLKAWPAFTAEKRIKQIASYHHLTQHWTDKKLSPSHTTLSW